MQRRRSGRWLLTWSRRRATSRRGWRRGRRGGGWAAGRSRRIGKTWARLPGRELHQYTVFVVVVVVLVASVVISSFSSSPSLCLISRSSKSGKKKKRSKFSGEEFFTFSLDGLIPAYGDPSQVRNLPTSLIIRVLYNMKSLILLLNTKCFYSNCCPFSKAFIQMASKSHAIFKLRQRVSFSQGVTAV